MLRNERVNPDGKEATASVEIHPELLVRLASATQPALDHRELLFSDGDTVAAALAVSPEERSELEKEWVSVRDRMLAKQQESLSFVEGEEELWIGSEPFDGSSQREAFTARVVEVLGESRGSAFLELTHADDAFGGWGSRRSAAYSIRTESQSDGRWVYRITERQQPDGPAGRSWVSAEIPPHIRKFTDGLGIPGRPQ